MKLVAHISDLHFGAHDPVIAATLLDELNGRSGARAELVVISGDLTQRARRLQFAQARGFLRALEMPYLVVPGNHDIPMFDLFTRFVRGRERYRRYISDDLTPFYADDAIAVAGVDTVKRFTIKSGAVRHEQIAAACEWFERHPFHWKLLVAHHPLIVAPDAPAADKDLVGDAAMALPLLEAVQTDMILTGHLHIPYSQDFAGRNESHSMIAVHAGSGISVRLRGHPNGYNRLCFDGSHCRITLRVWDQDRFVEGAVKSYYRRPAPGAERLLKE